MQVKPRIIAHRGASAYAPENTLAAFLAAIQLGAEGIELDVHLDKNGELVVIHDPTVNRTTGIDANVNDLTAGELANLDAGSWFSPQFQNEGIPTLEAVLRILPPGYWVNVEIKYAPSQDHGITRKLGTALKRWQPYLNFVISSFEHSLLKEVYEVNSCLPLGLLYYQKQVDILSYAQSLPYPVYSLHPDFSLVTKEGVAEAHAAGFKIYPFTVDKKTDALHMMEAEVDGIITNVPDQLIKWRWESIRHHRS